MYTYIFLYVYIIYIYIFSALSLSLYIYIYIYIMGKITTLLFHYVTHFMLCYIERDFLISIKKSLTKSYGNNV